MSAIAALFLLTVLGSVLLYVLTTASPAAIAGALRMMGPLTLTGIGGLLTLLGRAGLGVPMVMIGLSLWARYRSVSPIRSGSTTGQKSTVRSAWLEMELDHDTGEMEGFVLTGPFDGKFLSNLDQVDILKLYAMLEQDADSRSLLSAYLDRVFPAWSENLDNSSGPEHTATMSSGAMSKEEAYQVLGLDPGAGSDEITQAHRRLMKQVHPDQGGSTFLAAKINQAKETLLN